MGQRDLRLELVEVRADTQEVRTMLDEVKVKGFGRHAKGAALMEVQTVRGGALITSQHFQLTDHTAQAGSTMFGFSVASSSFILVQDYDS